MMYLFLQRKIHLYSGWGIEAVYGYIKEELQLGLFSGLSPIYIEQDFAANFFLFNLQSIIEKQCSLSSMPSKRKENIDTRSIKIAVGLPSNIRVVKLFLTDKPAVILSELKKLS